MGDVDVDSQFEDEGKGELDGSEVTADLETRLLKTGNKRHWTMQNDVVSLKLVIFEGKFWNTMG